MTAHDPTSTSAAAPSRYAATVQKAALAMGAVFLLVGILGFIPGITTNYDQLTFAGHHSEAALLSLFNVSVLHNIVHLAFGVAGLALARTFNSARLYLLVGGVIYLLLFLYGLVIDHQSAVNFVPVNDADNWLHLGLAIFMVGLGRYWVARTATTMPRSAPTAPRRRDTRPPEPPARRTAPQRVQG